jgi:hypothetical protein
MNDVEDTFHYAISSALRRAPWDFAIDFKTFLEPSLDNYLPKLSRLVGSVGNFASRFTGDPSDLPALWGVFLLEHTDESAIKVKGLVDASYWFDETDVIAALIKSNVHSVELDGWRKPVLDHRSIRIESNPRPDSWIDYIGSPDAVVGSFGRKLVRYA